MFRADARLHARADGQYLRVVGEGVQDLSRVQAQTIQVERAAEETSHDQAVAASVNFKVNVVGSDGDLDGG